MQAEIYPTTLAGVESKIPYRNKNIKVTCGCPIDEPTLRMTEPSGKPTKLGVVQKRGKIFLSWTDNSLCESGFGFDRQGSSFTPDYEVESEKTCLASHSPTQIYDDLAASAALVPVGSTQTYCVRAVNDVGYDSGYSSNATCKDVVIAWETLV